MKTRIKQYFLMMLLLGLGACGNKVGRSATGDKDLQLQVSQIIDNSSESEISLKVRIIPSAKMLASLAKEDNIKLQFDMDSCFYELNKKKAKYPAMVQNINNGQKGNYEYLVAFEPDKNTGDSLSFFYKDRFLNKKLYSVKIPLHSN